MNKSYKQQSQQITLLKKYIDFYSPENKTKALEILEGLTEEEKKELEFFFSENLLKIQKEYISILLKHGMKLDTKSKNSELTPLWCIYISTVINC